MTRRGLCWIVLAWATCAGGATGTWGQDTTPSLPPQASANASAEAAPPPQPPQDPVGRLTDEEFGHWTKALEATEYTVRSTATERLLDMAPEQLPRFVALLREGTLETVQRGTLVLQHLALVGDDLQQRAARETLESLAQPGPSLLASRARESLRAVAQEMRHRAVTQLSAAGAQYFQTSSQQLGLARLDTLRFGRSWRGELSLLEQLRWLPELQTVMLDGPHVDDRWLPFLAQLPNLGHLRIRKANITNEGIKTLKQLSQLRYLEIYYVALNDDAVPALSELRISQLIMFGNQISKDKASVLKEATGADNVDLRPGGAFLGIGCARGPAPLGARGCIVTEVKPNSSAEKAGIQLSDEILEYDDVPIKEFDKMVELIGQQHPGDTCKVKLLRQDEPLTFEIVLGEWIEQ